MNSDILRKTKNTKPLIIFLAVTIVLMVLAFVIPNILGTQGKNFKDNRNSTYEAIYLEIDDAPIEFQTFNDGKMRKFYLVKSGDEIYIAKISEKQYEIILEEKENKGDNFKFTLEGRSYSIFSNLKESVKKTFNDTLGEKVVTDNNFKEYFGASYIDAGDNTKGLIKAMLFGFGVLFAVVDVIMIIGYVYGMKTYKKVMTEYGEDELVKELDDKDTIALPKAGIYLTKKYIISNSTGFKVVDYKDIAWIYILKQRNHGILVGSHLMVYKRNGKGDTLATMRKPEELEKLMPSIAKKNKNILVGYTSENQKKFKDIVKESK